VLRAPIGHKPPFAEYRYPVGWITERSRVTMNELKGADALCAALDTLPEGEGRVPLLIRLLGQGGHERHEDIVFELGLVGDPAAVPVIAWAVVNPFSYLDEWGNLHEFQRKCAYALARIGTPDSRAALETLARHTDLHLREYGEEGLGHWPLPFRAR
jgi:hypothetical protein